MLSPNIILPYDNTHASIPATFTRETALDGQFIKGTAAAVNPNVTGGASTHTHTSASHSHTVDSHTHTTGTTGTYNPPPDSDAPGSGSLTTGHSHTSSTTNAAIGSASGTASYSAVSNNPPYYEVIFIKSSLYNFIPQSALVLTTATSRTSLTYHSSSAGKYLRGATTSGNAGGTGGTYDNSHDMSHTHTGSHYHTGQTPSGPGGGGGGGSGSNTVVNDSHYHNYTLTSVNDSLIAPTTTTYAQYGASGENIEPVYKTLNPFKNSSGGSVVPAPGDIGLWLGTLASIPLGWSLCDGTNGTPDMRDKFLKMTGSATSSTTGGSNTHAHPGISHTHTVSGSHTHITSYTDSSSGGSHTQGGGGGGRRTGPSHVHDLPNLSSVTAAYAAGTVTPNSSDNQPLFTTVAYVQMIYETIGAGALALL